MKTTIDLSDALLAKAKERAAREGRTLRALLEEGLRAVLEGQAPAAPFKLRRAAFRGKGLADGAAGASWERLRAMIYEGRGA